MQLHDVSRKTFHLIAREYPNVFPSSTPLSGYKFMLAKVKAASSGI